VALLRVSEALEDETATALHRLGCLGVQPEGGQLELPGTERCGPRMLEAIFEWRPPHQRQQLATDIELTLTDLRRGDAVAELCGIAELAAQDWLQEYRARAQPIAIGRFVFDPRDWDPEADRSRAAAAGDRFCLVLPAEQAFGTGSHETTRMMVELLEALDGVGEVTGRLVLDVGSGSGILGLTARRLGARRVVGVEIDLVSTFVARRNAQRNAEALDFVAGGVECLGGASPAGGEAGDDPHVEVPVVPGFGLILVNILPHRIAGQEAGIRRTLAPGGSLLLAGFLTDQRDEILGRWCGLGLTVHEVVHRGDWMGAWLRSGGGK
jgi:ribosomal protein L11 methyltransferase